MLGSPAASLLDKSRQTSPELENTGQDRLLFPV